MIHWVALNLVEGLKPIHRSALMKAFDTPIEVFRRSEMELTQVSEIKPEMAYRILHFDFHMAEAELSRAGRLGVEVLSLSDPEYPALLRNIPDPPLVLYVRGKLMKMEPAVALVGSRKPTPYGLNVTQFLAHDLARAGITVVSGLARGIDARAHSAALESGARTIAVLGSGVDIIYPSEHRLLAEQIARQGALVSEFPLGTPPHREHFPIRNRIISGLSHGVVVVEASDKSGSLITARTAMEQGREVMAVPGSIFNESSKGCHALIKDGAAMVRNWEDILAELPEEVVKHTQELDRKEETAPVLSDVEKNVIGLLSFEQPKHIDQLAGISGIQSQELLAALANLELKNYISQMPGKHFIRLK